MVAYHLCIIIAGRLSARGGKIDAKENPAYFLRTPRFKSFQNRSLSLRHDVANWHSAANDSQQFSPPDD